MHEAIYPDPNGPARIPIVVVMGDDTPDDEARKLLQKQWGPDWQPTIILWASEARSLTGQLFSAIAKLEPTHKK
jgi:hypothetical protein